MYHQARVIYVPLTRQQMLENMVEHYLMQSNPPGFNAGCQYYVPPTGSLAAQMCGIGLQLGLDLAKEVQEAFTEGATVQDIMNVDDDDGNRTPEEIAAAMKFQRVISHEDVAFADRLQKAHDDSALAVEDLKTPEGLREFRLGLWNKLMRVAVDYSLILKPINTSW